MNEDSVKQFLREWKEFQDRWGCTIGTFRGDTCASFANGSSINLDAGGAFIPSDKTAATSPMG